MIATALVRHAQVTFPRGTGRLPGWGIGGARKLGRHFELVHANDVDEALELFDCQGRRDDRGCVARPSVRYWRFSTAAAGFSGPSLIQNAGVLQLQSSCTVTTCTRARTFEQSPVSTP